MHASRRRFLAAGVTVAAGATAVASARCLRPFDPRARHGLALHGESCRPPVTHSITPVVFDGKWLWDEQPADQRGYVDPRPFRVRSGIRWRSNGHARNLRATTVVPAPQPGQDFEEPQVTCSPGCEAKIVPLDDSVAQLQVFAPAIRPDQELVAQFESVVTLSRYCPHFTQEMFPDPQSVPSEFRKRWTGNSPGIRVESRAVKALAAELCSRHEHPWQSAMRFFEWVWQNIAGRPGAYTSVAEALETRQGDCEERAGTFVALCRSIEIPARLVLVPNHCWAEFCLFDESGTPQWIPAHTAAYNWFGWTGTHELTLQKGDRIWQPGTDKYVRLVSDWYAYEGRKPAIEYFGELIPETGPGTRTKNAAGGWDRVDSHPDDRLLRS